MTWSQITDHPLAKDAVGAIKYYTEDLGLTYHNYDHVLSMYNYLEETDEPYDEALDWAVLFHDIVYDKEPDKEARSAKMFDFNANIEKYYVDPIVIGRAKEMILATSDHVVKSPELSAIIRADLHGLADYITTIRNFANIMEESCNLYSIEPDVVANQSLIFMQDLQQRVHKNVSLDPKNKDFYQKVLQGIEMIKSLSTLIKEQYQ